jgi:predicted peptidase
MTLIALIALLQDGFESKTFESAERKTLTYGLLKPAETEKDKTYPLVLCLHGRGGNSHAAAALAGADMRKKHPCFVVAPSVDTNKFRWAAPAGAKGGGEAALPLVIELLDALQKELPVDAGRVYVTGQSMGGYGTFGALAGWPERFAAAVPVCGGWDPKDAEKFAKVPLWAFHGADDPTVPVEQSRRMIEAMKKAGGEPKYTELEGVKHNSWEKAYATAEMWEWLFQQSRKAK